MFGKKISNWCFWSIVCLFTALSHTLVVDDSIAAGVGGYALQFPTDPDTTNGGTQDIQYVRINFPNTLEHTARTTSFWFKAPKGGHGYFLVYMAEGGNYGNPRFKLESDGDISWAVDESEGDKAFRVDGTYNDGMWHHLVNVTGIKRHTVEQEKTGQYLYIDGKEVYRSDTAETEINRNNKSIIIGFSPNLAGQHFYGGCIDDVAVWETALTEQEVLMLYHGGSPTSSEMADSETYLKGYWPFVNGSGDRVKDVTGRSLRSSGFVPGLKSDYNPDGLDPSDPDDSKWLIKWVRPKPVWLHNGVEVDSVDFGRVNLPISSIFSIEIADDDSYEHIIWYGLDGGKVNSLLRDAFEANGIHLPDNPSVIKVPEKSDQWLIQGGEGSYLAWLEHKNDDGWWLSIYDAQDHDSSSPDQTLTLKNDGDLWLKYRPDKAALSDAVFQLINPNGGARAPGRSEDFGFSFSETHWKEAAEKTRNGIYSEVVPIITNEAELDPRGELKTSVTEELDVHSKVEMFVKVFSPSQLKFVKPVPHQKNSRVNLALGDTETFRVEYTRKYADERVKGIEYQICLEGGPLVDTWMQVDGFREIEENNKEYLEFQIPFSESLEATEYNLKLRMINHLGCPTRHPAEHPIRLWNRPGQPQVADDPDNVDWYAQGSYFFGVKGKDVRLRAETPQGELNGNQIARYIWKMMRKDARDEVKQEADLFTAVPGQTVLFTFDDSNTMVSHDGKIWLQCIAESDFGVWSDPKDFTLKLYKPVRVDPGGPYFSLPNQPVELQAGIADPDHYAHDDGSDPDMHYRWRVSPEPGLRFQCGDTVGDYPTLYPIEVNPFPISEYVGSEMSVAFWVKPSQLRDDDRLLYFLPSTGPNRNWKDFCIQGSDGLKVGFREYPPSDSGNDTGISLQEDKWYHITVTWRVAEDLADHIKVYVYAEGASDPETWERTHLAGSESLFSSDDLALVIGRNFDGYIDDVSIWRRVLLEEDILKLRDGVLDEPESLVGLWKLDAIEVDDGSRMVRDYSGLRNHGLVSGNVHFSFSHIYNQFDANNIMLELNAGNLPPELSSSSVLSSLENPVFEKPQPLGDGWSWAVWESGNPQDRYTITYTPSADQSTFEFAVWVEAGDHGEASCQWPTSRDAEYVAQCEAKVTTQEGLEIVGYAPATVTVRAGSPIARTGGPYWGGIAGGDFSPVSFDKGNRPGQKETDTEGTLVEIEEWRWRFTKTLEHNRGLIFSDGVRVDVESFNPSLINNKHLSLSAWVKVQSGDGGNIIAVDGCSLGVAAATTEIAGHALFRITTSMGSYQIGSRLPVDDNEIPEDDVWHHIAGAYDGSEMRLYVDGILQSSGKASGGIKIQANSVSIGGDFTGCMDEVTVWNEAIEQWQVDALRLGRLPAGTGLLGYWPFNEGAGTLTENVAAEAVDEIDLPGLSDIDDLWVGTVIDERSDPEPKVEYEKAGQYPVTLQVKANTGRWSSIARTTVTILDGSIRGTVRAADLRTPAVGVQLKLTTPRMSGVLGGDLSSLAMPSNGLVATNDGGIYTTTSEEGRYQFQNLPLGTYRIEVSKVEETGMIHKFQEPAVRALELTLEMTEQPGVDFVDLSVYPVGGTISSLRHDLELYDPGKPVCVEGVVVEAIPLGTSNTIRSTPSDPEQDTTGRNYVLPLFGGEHLFLVQLEGRDISLAGHVPYEPVNPEPGSAEVKAWVIAVTGATNAIDFVDKTERTLKVMVEDPAGAPVESLIGESIAMAIKDGVGQAVKEVEQDSDKTIITFKLPPGKYTLKTADDFQDEGYFFRDPDNAEELVSGMKGILVDLEGGDRDATMVIPVPIELQIGPRPKLLSAPLSYEAKEALAELLGVSVDAIDDLENCEGYMFYWAPAPQRYTYAIRATANSRPVKGYALFVTDDVSLMTEGTAAEQRITVSPVLTVEDNYDIYVQELEGLGDAAELPANVSQLFSSEASVDLSDNTWVRKISLPELDKGWIITDWNSGNSYFLRVEEDGTLYADDGAYTVLGGLPAMQKVGDNRYALADKTISFQARKRGYGDSESRGDTVRVLGDRAMGEAPEIIATPEINYLVLHDPPGDHSYAYVDDSLVIKGVIEKMEIRAKDDDISIPVYPSPWTQERIRKYQETWLVGEDSPDSDPNPYSELRGEGNAGAWKVPLGAIIGAPGFGAQYEIWRQKADKLGDEFIDPLGLGMTQFSIRPERKLETMPSEEIIESEFPDLVGPGRGDVYFGEGLTIGIQQTWRFGLEYDDVTQNWIEVTEDIWGYNLLGRKNQYVYTARDIESVIDKLDGEENAIHRERWEDLLISNPAYVWSEFYIYNQDKIDKLNDKVDAGETLSPLEKFHLEELENARDEIELQQDKNAFEAFRNKMGLPRDNEDGVETLIFSGGTSYEYSRAISEGRTIKYYDQATVSTNANFSGQFDVGLQMALKNPWWGWLSPKLEIYVSTGVSLSYTTSRGLGTEFEAGQEVEQRVGFVLQDNDVGDQFATRVYECPEWGTPLFIQDLGSVTSNPWEPGTNKGIDVTLKRVPHKLDLSFTMDFDQFDDTEQEEIISQLDGDAGSPTFPDLLLPEFQEKGIQNPASVTVQDAGSRWMIRNVREGDYDEYILRLEPDAYGVDQLNVYKVMDEKLFDYHAGAHYKVQVEYTGKRDLESDYTTFDFMLYAPQTDNKDTATVRFNEQPGTYLSYKVGLTKEAPVADIAVSIYPPVIDQDNPYQKEYTVMIVAQEVDDAQIISSPVVLTPRFADLREPSASIIAPYQGQRIGPTMFAEPFEIQVVSEDMDVEEIKIESRYKDQSGVFGAWGLLPGVELKEVQQLRKAPPYNKYIFKWSEKPGAGEYQLRAVAEDTAGNLDLDPAAVGFTMDNTQPDVLTTIPDYQARESERMYRGELSVIFTDDMRADDFSPGKESGDGTYDVLNLLTGEHETAYVSYSPALRKVVFVPETPFQANGFYKATMKKEVRDLAGNPMKRDFSWTFRTTDMPSEETWHIALSATNGMSTDADNIAGIDYDARDRDEQYDRMDAIDPRGLPGFDGLGISLSFLDPAQNKLDRDFRPADGRASYHWFFVVESVINSTVTIQIQPSPELTNPNREYQFIELVKFDTNLTDGSDDTVVIDIEPDEPELLFSVGLGSQSDLNNGVISEDLRQRFEDNGILLSDDAFVVVEEADVRWLITDSGNVYTIREQAGKLNVYQAKIEYNFTADAAETYFRLDVKKADLVAADFTVGTSGWRFFSVPIVPQRSEPFVNLGDDIDPFMLYQYHTESGSFKVYPLDVGEVALAPGYGYFTRLSESVEVDVVGSYQENALELKFGKAGWYAIGNPFFAPVSIGYLRANGRQLYQPTPTYPYPSSMVDFTLYRLRIGDGGQTDTYEMVVFQDLVNPDNEDAAKLEPWEGYWIRTKVDNVILTIPRPSNLPSEPDLPGSFDPRPSAAPPLARSGAAGQFDLRLALTSNFASDMTTSLGTSGEASLDLDALDKNEPPILSQTVATYFDRPEWGGIYNTDYQPAMEVGDTRTWEFVAFTDRQKAKMALSWAAAIEGVPDDIFLSFRREGEEEWRDMREVQSVEIASESRTTKVKFQVRAERFAMSPPADVQVTAGEAQVEIRWKAEDNPFIEGYSISRRAVGYNQPTVITLKPGVDRYVDTDVQEEETYTYQISVRFRTGAELHSDLFTATVLPVIQETALLQNYPNPFNPETWIPYDLAEDADVSVEIYAATGQLIRHLDLGSQKRGRYFAREKAVHWDGCNEYGEAAASGTYFYVLRAGGFSATRKMVVLR